MRVHWKEPSGRWILLLLAVALFLLIYPIWVIRPFRPQGAKELLVALIVLRWAGWGTLLCSLAAIYIVVTRWRQGAGRWVKLGLVAGLVLVLGVTLLARVNIYEKMFHPLEHPQFLASAQAPVEPTDMVIAVRVGSEARAYPIRTMAYHHVVNDTVGGVPLIATY
jgi:hypothetical protein